MENLNKLIGERIAKLRKENHMTQAMLAEKLNISVRHCSAIRRSSNKYIDLFPDSLIQSLQSGTDAELDLFKQYIQMFHKIYSSKKDSK